MGRGIALAYHGDAAAAQAAADAAIEATAELGGLKAGAAYWALAIAALAAGDAAMAQDATEAAWPHVSALRGPVAMHCVLAAQAALAGGDVVTARRWADDPSQATKPVGRLVGNKTYHYQKGFKSSFGGNILTPDLSYGNPTIRRDTNHNHRIDSGDKVYSGDWGGQGVYFHRGATNDTYSAGCQTMDQGRFNSFWAALGGQSKFSYVLANV